MVAHVNFSTSTLHRIAACCLILGSLTGCDEPLASPPVVGASQAPQVDALVITELQLFQKTLVGAETMDLDLTVEKPGSQTIAQYGLRTPYGEKTFPFKPTLTVIPNGRLSLKKLGPPAVGKAGKMTVEIWLIDSAGNRSNALSAEVLVQ